MYITLFLVQIFSNYYFLCLNKNNILLYRVWYVNKKKKEKVDKTFL